MKNPKDIFKEMCIESYLYSILLQFHDNRFGSRLLDSPEDYKTISLCLPYNIIVDFCLSLRKCNVDSDDMRKGLLPQSCLS